MFTGIVQGMARVERLDASSAGARLTLHLGPLADGLSDGASVAVSGACLTVCEPRDGRCTFDVIYETLARTNLGELRPGDAVNIERSLRAGDPLDGHFLQGHVDGLARVTDIGREAGEYRLWLAADEPVLRYIVPKGSVALDGVSLTIADLLDDRFSVALIPTTLERTTLGRRRPGDRLNVETDMIVRSIARLLERGSLAAPQRSAITLDMLREHGYLESRTAPT